MAPAQRVTTVDGMEGQFQASTCPDLPSLFMVVASTHGLLALQSWLHCTSLALYGQGVVSWHA